ncbi:MAG: S-layer homology domain-containing protein [Solibacillus sp.]
MKKQTYKKLFTVATASAMAAGAVVAVAPAQADAASKFSDVKETNTHYANIVELTQRGVITGYEDGTYRPGNSINRANAAKIIAGVLGLDTKNVTNPGFSDVSVNNANYGPIAALANAGIINGFEGKFNPGGTLTRGQMAKIIDNAFNLAEGDVATLPFTDVQKSQYKVNIANLFASKVTTGVTATKFDEKSPVTRGQLASFVVRAEQAQQTDGGSETPGTETPGSTTTSEKAVTLLNVTNNLVTINGEQFSITPEVAGVFNAVNAEALKDAEATLVIESLVEPIAGQNAKVVGVKSLKLVKSGTSFDAKGNTIPTLTVAANNITVANAETTALEVTAGNTATLNGVTATTVTVGKGAKITLGENFKIATIKLASGDKIETAITNYAAVKDLLKDTKIEQSSTGGGGGGGSSTGSAGKTPPAVAIEEARKQINEGLKDLTIGSATFDGSKLNINLGATEYTVADALNDKDVLFASIEDSNILASVESVTIGRDTYTVDEAKGLSNLRRALILAEFLNLPDEDLETLLADPEQDLTKFLKSSSKSVTVKFKNGSTKAYPVNIVK